ncbi:SDR family NAD(P)-dependent oxidoreductase [Roseomonas sp. GCM10028921]
MRGFSLQGRTAIVTGAAGGIGAAIAHHLAARGCNLILADLRSDTLAVTASKLAGVEVETHTLDVSDVKAIEAFHQVIAASRPSLDVLVNNAGVALGGTFEEVSPEDFEWLFSINFWGVVRLTRAFLPMLRAAPEARLVNLSSLFGLIALPGQTAYCASKFAVRGFSEALRKELAGSSVGVTVIHPGGVNTGIADSARVAKATSADVEQERQRVERFLKMPADVAGKIIVDSISRRRDRVLVGSDARMASVIERIAPVHYWPILRRAIGL